jgi:small conductance mechanosensitive channel
LEPPVVQGILSLGSSEVTLRISIKVKPMTQLIGMQRENLSAGLKIPLMRKA